MSSTESFALFDCSLARYAIGRRCSNLRELLEAVRTVPDMVLEHHMMRCALDDPFELYEFPNDLARWCWEALGDHVLAEELSLVDPYHHPTIAALRALLVNTIEERLWGMEHAQVCRPGLELHLVGSRLVAYDTGERIPTPAALAEAMPRLSLRSFFYHVHEAYRRRRESLFQKGLGTGEDAGKNGTRSRFPPPFGTYAEPADDFSVWLESFGAEAALVARLREIDFYFRNLSQLRHEFIEVLQQDQSPEPQAIVRATHETARSL